MTKIAASLRRFLLPCFTPSSATNPATSTKKRLSTSLRDDLADDHPSATADADSSGSSSPSYSTSAAAPPRSSKSMVIGTIFGSRRGHVWFSVQHDRLSAKPSLLLELSVPIQQLVREMRFGLVRITLECCPDDRRPDLATCPLRSVPVWSLHCNGRKLGFAARRRAGDNVRLILKTMQSTTVGAGALPPGFTFGSKPPEDSESEHDPIMYMRANYEHVVGGADSESFHLINPDQGPGQELSLFLLRSRNSA